MENSPSFFLTLLPLLLLFFALFTFFCSYLSVDLTSTRYLKGSLNLDISVHIPNNRDGGSNILRYPFSIHPMIPLALKLLLLDHE
jgi:hypothetical protein